MSKTVAIFLFPLLLFIVEPVQGAALQLEPSKVESQTIVQFVDQNPKDIAGQLGRKLSLKERLALRVLRRKLRKHPEFGQENWEVVNASLNAIQNDDECDHVFLLDGTKMDVSIYYISETEVTFENCNSTDGNVYSLPTSEILLARDFRDVTLYLTPDRAQRRFLDSEILPKEGRERMDKLALWSGVLSIVSVLTGPLFLLFMPAAIILSLFSFGRYRDKTYRYLGKGMAKVPFFIVGSLLIVALLILYFAGIWF